MKSMKEAQSQTFIGSWHLFNKKNLMEHLLFFIGLSFLTVHEMDAIRCKEWRIFPGLALLNDKTGYLVFLLTHILLFFIVFYQLTYSSDNTGFIKGFEVFLIVHVGLHLLFLNHKKNEFKGWLSWMLITGAGLFGLADLLLVYHPFP